jgi:hypothetical protein
MRVYSFKENNDVEINCGQIRGSASAGRISLGAVII